MHICGPLQTRMKGQRGPPSRLGRGGQSMRNAPATMDATDHGHVPAQFRHALPQVSSSSGESSGKQSGFRISRTDMLRRSRSFSDRVEAGEPIRRPAERMLLPTLGTRFTETIFYRTNFAVVPVFHKYLLDINANCPRKPTGGFRLVGSSCVTGATNESRLPFLANAEQSIGRDTTIV